MVKYAFTIFARLETIALIGRNNSKNEKHKP